ncbi:hypothetical protein MRX96_046180 [Rhipicephalus microplus]
MYMLRKTAITLAVLLPKYEYIFNGPCKQFIILGTPDNVHTFTVYKMLSIRNSRGIRNDEIHTRPKIRSSEEHK